MTIYLTIHGIGTPGVSEQEVVPEMWMSTEQFSGLLDLSSPDTVFTFDDGFDSCWDIAFPELMKRRLTAKFFVTIGKLDKTGYLTKDQVRAMGDAGMSIGSHGMWHRPWRRLDPREIQVELFDAKDELEQILGTAVTEAACPFGAYDRRTLRSLRKSLIKRVYTSDRARAACNDWLVPRFTIKASDSQETIQRILTGEDKTSWLSAAKMVFKRWR